MPFDGVFFGDLIEDIETVFGELAAETLLIAKRRSGRHESLLVAVANTM